MVIDRGDISGQQQQHVRQVQIVDGQLGKTLKPPNEVIGEEPHHAGGQRRHAGQRTGRQQFHGGPQRLQWVPADGRSGRRGAQPHGLTIAHRQCRGGTGSDERPTRPGPAILGGLQQEGARTAGSQLAVGR